MGLALEKQNTANKSVETILEEDFGQLNKSTIMMVDDEPTTMEVIKAFLQESGYTNFVLIEDSREAMRALENLRPDLLLLDLIMPEVSGFDILRQVRAHQKFEHLPIIILTSSSDNKDKLLALDLGATDFLAKPVDPSELQLRVRNTLAAKAYTDQLAYCDPLTKLPNRHQFLERLDWSMRWARHDGNKLALLSIELDQYDNIKNKLGFSAGDEALSQFSERIQSAVRSIDVFGQFDFSRQVEFNLFHTDSGLLSILIDRIPSDRVAALIAERLLESIREPMFLEDTEHHITASIGIATYPTENVNKAQLLGLASDARDHVKDQGGNGFHFSSGEINTHYKNRLSIEAKLRKALDRDQFLLHYQPKLDSSTNQIMGVEALLRWDAGEGSFVSPDKFIPIAEEIGLIVPIGEWVLRNACKQAAEWQQAVKRPISMAVNISSLHFQDDNLGNVAEEAIAQNGLDPCLLTLELTESMLLEAIMESIDLMHGLKKIGLKLAIDDFGTGYSSLSYLTKFPLDELKIDRSFMQSLEEGDKSKALVSSMINLSRKLNLTTVAEGVETEEQLEFLKQERCELYQGYYFSPALSCDEVFKLIS